MKKTFKAILALAAVVFVSANTLQAQKFGFINSQELISAMPERDSVQIKLEGLSKELGEMLESIQVEFNNKLEDYQKGNATMSAATRQIKERELQDLQARFEEYQQMAQQDLQKQQQELMAPIIERATNAIKTVSKANGIVAVFDISSGALAFHDEKGMTDILPLVKKELKIADTAAAAPAKK